MTPSSLVPRRAAATLALALAALALLLAPARAQSCADINVRSHGAQGNGRSNDAPVFAAMNANGAIGIIYMPAGTYLISQSLILSLPVVAESGAVFSVAAGVTLSLQNQPEHPLTTFFTGSGSVRFLEGTTRVFPEWFGAAGNGRTDDSAAVRRAYAAIPASANAMLYLSKSYGLGSALSWKATTTIMSEPSARFVSVNGNRAGLTYQFGGAAFKNVLPHFDGFADYCFQLDGTDLGAFQLQTLNNCGDAIRFHVTPGSDARDTLDNTIWFDAINNARVAIAFRAEPGCIGATCVMQGNQIVGNTIAGGPTSGQVTGIGYYFSGTAAQVPAWDSNQFNLNMVTPPATAQDYAVVRATPLGNREVVKIWRIRKLPTNGRVFAGEHNIGQFNIGFITRIANGQLGLYGQINLCEIGGSLTPAQFSTVVPAVTRPNSLASFFGGLALVGNYFQMSVAPAADWSAGEVRVFYVYHQLATGYLFQIKCQSPLLASTKSPAIACVQAQDNTFGIGTTPVLYEIQLNMVNMSGATIKAGQAVPFTLTVGTMGQA